MTNTELERLIDLTLTEFMSGLVGMPEEDLCQIRSHPVVRYFTYRLLSPAERQAHFPASEEYYLSQARIADRRWKFQCQKTSIVRLSCTIIPCAARAAGP